MEVSDLIVQARLTLDDVTGVDSTRLWSDDELVGYLNDAMDKMCIKIRTLIYDSATTVDAAGNPLCSLSFVAGTGEYAVSPKIIHVIRITTTKRGVPLEDKNPMWLDNNVFRWWDVTNTGTPQWFCQTYKRNSLFFVRVPDATDTATISVYRRPLVPFTLGAASSTTPEIAEEYHRDMLPWVYHLCFSKNDTETLNKVKAAEWYQIAQSRWSEIQQVYLRKLGSMPNDVHRGML